MTSYKGRKGERKDGEHGENFCGTNLTSSPIVKDILYNHAIRETDTGFALFFLLFFQTKVVFRFQALTIQELVGFYYNVVRLDDLEDACGILFHC